MKFIAQLPADAGKIVSIVAIEARILVATESGRSYTVDGGGTVTEIKPMFPEPSEAVLARARAALGEKP